jgi:hypothetical protein
MFKGTEKYEGEASKPYRRTAEYYAFTANDMTVNMRNAENKIK